MGGLRVTRQSGSKASGSRPSFHPQEHRNLRRSAEKSQRLGPFARPSYGFASFVRTLALSPAYGHDAELRRSCSASLSPGSPPN